MLLPLFNLLCRRLFLPMLLPLLVPISLLAEAIPFERYRLDNGLTLIIHEDRKAPIVAVNIWYHVGSKDESEGKTGFAHLFEHLMFNGSENYDDEWFLALQDSGATDVNGTTWFDRTNYFQTVPVSALDRVLWMESDRMGHFINAVTQHRLDEQREVVKNEKRQGDNRPYGGAEYTQLEGVFPPGHPYRWSTIGSMEDLDAASLNDVRDWFGRYYGAANATLVIAGDVDPQQVREKVEYYFGDIAAGPSVPKKERWIAARQHSRRDVLYDEVPQLRLTRVWNTAAFGERDNVLLQLAAAVMGQGKGSRLYRRLVQQERLLSSVSVNQSAFEIAGLFEIECYLKEGVETAQVEAIIDSELAEFFQRGPTREELQRVKTVISAARIRGGEKVGGFSGKAQTLARYQTYLGDAALYQRDVEWTEIATARDIRLAASRWLSVGDYNLELRPEPQYHSAKVSADRSSLPAISKVPLLKLATPVEFYLSNGLRVLLSSRVSVPVTEISLLLDSGYAADSRDKLGLAAITAAMLDEGSERSSGEEISERLERLGARLAVEAALDTSIVSLSALDDNLSESLALFAEVVRRPLFPTSELSRIKSNWQQRIAQEKSSPYSIALRRLPPLLYGEQHPYGIPFTGSGHSDTVAGIEQADIERFYRRHYRPDSATLVVVGEHSEAQLKPLLEKYLGSWEAVGPAPTSLPAIAPQSVKPGIYLIDKPGAPQSLILGGQLVAPSRSPDNEALEMANRILGGGFTARINMNLREDKGWAYGARSMIVDTRNSRPLLYYAPVQSDKTASALAELISEAERYRSVQPPTEPELRRFQASLSRSLAGQFESNRAWLSALTDIVSQNRPLDYVQRRQQQIAALELRDLFPVIERSILPQRTIWLIVGDLERIAPTLRALDSAPVIVLDVNESSS